jgi:hypothetical protein
VVQHDTTVQDDPSARWQKVSGTSYAAAAIAALSALVGDPEAGTRANGYVYGNAEKKTTPNTLFDVTNGNNWSTSGAADCKTKLCNAGPGWDGPTGWGVPVGPDVLRPPNNGLGDAKAALFRVSGKPTPSPTSGCLGVARDAKFAAPWPTVRTVSCTDASYNVKWQVAPLAVQGEGRDGEQYVLEDQNQNRIGCLSAPLKPGQYDGVDVVLAPCTSPYDAWYPRDSGKIQLWTSKTYLYASSSTTDSSNVKLRATAANRFVVEPTA